MTRLARRRPPDASDETSVHSSRFLFPRAEATRLGSRALFYSALLSLQQVMGDLGFQGLNNRGGNERVAYRGLAEAILTEPAALTADDTGSILLADTRTRPRTSDENERQVFLPGEDTDEEDEAALREERRHALSNSGAQLSPIDIRRTVGEEQDYETLPRGRGPPTAKKITNPIIGIRGVGPMLEELVGTDIKAVAIGGINFALYMEQHQHRIVYWTALPLYQTLSRRLNPESPLKYSRQFCRSSGRALLFIL
ncbi:hypothetical protein BDZ97DRAFT_1761306 [Flammula alnicola]|nr:hypothetical protein BDZ97DRAFT_1761306 [Flammula alnicola]